MDARWCVDRLALEETFFRLEFIHSYKPNANRATLVVGAFTTDIVIFQRGAYSVVAGSNEDLSEFLPTLHARMPGERIVAFRLAAQDSSAERAA
jgi:hypothetical protein